VKGASNRFRNLSRHCDPARRRDFLQTRRYVDLVTINVFRVGDDPAAAQANAENDAMIIRLILAALGHALLHLDRTAHCIDRCTEFSQNAVPVDLTNLARCSAIFGSISSWRWDL